MHLLKAMKKYKRLTHHFIIAVKPLYKPCRNVERLIALGGYFVSISRAILVPIMLTVVEDQVALQREVYAHDQKSSPKPYNFASRVNTVQILNHSNPLIETAKNLVPEKPQTCTFAR